MAIQLGFIGLGQMGQAITSNLVAKANLQSPLILHNRTRQRAVEHSAKIGHSVVAKDLTELVSTCDIIWLCLEDDKAVNEIFAEILGLRIGGKLFVDCSTLLPDATRQLTQRVENAGAFLVAMPVFGEPSMAWKGLLICVPAGPASCVERIRPYLTDVICRAVVDLGGEEPAQSSLLKCIGNVLIMTTIEQIAEAHVFAEKSGLGTKHMASLIETMFPRPPHSVYSAKMTSGEYTRGEVCYTIFNLVNCSIVDVAKAKTLTSQILQLASASSASLKSYEVAVNHLAVAEAHAGPRCDIMGIYGAVRVESGLAFVQGDGKTEPKPSEGN